MTEDEFDVVIVGAGFAGLYMLHRLRGMGFSALVLEAGDGVGGTWYWNRYPGARCDVASMEYSYQFSEDLQQEWEWSERYASQPEILRYANHVADRFDLRSGIRLNCRVVAATFDEAETRWRVECADGSRLTAPFCVMATGCLSSTNTPDFAGLESFAGPTYHTGLWPHEGVDFAGLRVGVIGTGSSAVQSIPLIAREADRVTVFQRTPNYVVPARNAPMDPAYQAAFKADYANLRARAKRQRTGNLYLINDVGALAVGEAERRQEYQVRWDLGGLGFMGSFADLLIDKEANDTAADFVRDKIRRTVKRADVAETLLPWSVVGCKRLCIDTGYYETFNRANVSLVDVSKTPIEAITAAGVMVAGREYAADALVFATGFDAMTGALTAVRITGTGGATIADKWAAGPRAYLGLASAGFPNLFTITGPGSPSVLSNMLPSIEQHVEWIADCLDFMRAHDKRRIEPTEAAEDGWVEHVNAVAERTLFPTCNSWYMGANVPGKTRVFMPYLGFPTYVEKCDRVAAAGYEGFAVS